MLIITITIITIIIINTALVTTVTYYTVPSPPPKRADSLAASSRCLKLFFNNTGDGLIPSNVKLVVTVALCLLQ
jgi:hypothetical protein